MAEECKNKDVLYETMKLSFSCSSQGKARWKQLMKCRIKIHKEWEFNCALSSMRLIK